MSFFGNKKLFNLSNRKDPFVSDGVGKIARPSGGPLRQPIAQGLRLVEGATKIAPNFVRAK